MSNAATVQRHGDVDGDTPIGDIMGWANRAITELADGKEATIKPHGGSMRPKVESGARVKLEPVHIAAL